MLCVFLNGINAPLYAQNNDKFWRCIRDNYAIKNNLWLFKFSYQTLPLITKRVTAVQNVIFQLVKQTNANDSSKHFVNVDVDSKNVPRGRNSDKIGQQRLRKPCPLRGCVPQDTITCISHKFEIIRAQSSTWNSLRKISRNWRTTITHRRRSLVTRNELIFGHQ